MKPHSHLHQFFKDGRDCKKCSCHLLKQFVHCSFGVLKKPRVFCNTSKPCYRFIVLLSFSQVKASLVEDHTFGGSFGGLHGPTSGSLSTACTKAYTVFGGKDMAAA